VHGFNQQFLAGHSDFLSVYLNRVEGEADQNPAERVLAGTEGQAVTAAHKMPTDIPINIMMMKFW
jgi:hypothetical protein